MSKMWCSCPFSVEGSTDRHQGKKAHVFGVFDSTVFLAGKNSGIYYEYTHDYIAQGLIKAYSNPPRMMPL